MDLEKRINAFSKLGIVLQQIHEVDLEGEFPVTVYQKHQQLQQLAQQVHVYNKWFTPENVLHAISAIGEMLEQDKIMAWLSKYNQQVLNEQKNKKVGVIMAGNLPLVGFHDFLCVLISGNKISTKLSSDDNKLLPLIAEMLLMLEPKFHDKIKFHTDRLKNVDAYIATGSNNTSRYFEYYFGKYPNIIRKNRSSIAVLTGDETSDELKELAKDVFLYFGLGCRNVTQLLVPKQYNFNSLFEAFEVYSNLINHNKYANNYEYNKSIFLVNKVSHFDNGFVLLKKSDEISSPVACLYFDYYDHKDKVERFVNENQQLIQCVVGNDDSYIPFGQSQKPELWDYADGIDTVEFLMGL